MSKAVMEKDNNCKGNPIRLLDFSTETQQTRRLESYIQNIERQKPLAKNNIPSKITLSIKEK